MGGQSCCCPKCHKWFIQLGQLKDHYKAKHYNGPLKLEGTGTAVEVVEMRDTSL